MAVRNGLNKTQNLNPFHAFVLSTLAGFGGGWMGFVWLGKPSSMIISDVGLACSIVAFVMVNSPLHAILCWLPCKVAYTALAQLFRAFGMIGFISAAFKEASASSLYPIPLLGPVVYGTLLGNMGLFLSKGGTLRRRRTVSVALFSESHTCHAE